MTKGIILAAFGSQKYVGMAVNMALSIKHYNKDLKVCLIHDEEVNKIPKHWHFVWDEKILIDKEDMFDGYKFDPGKLKCNIYKYLPYDHNLYLDVDGLAMQDLEGELDRFIAMDGYYYAEVIGKGKKEDKIEYSIWADNEFIWNHFNLEDSQEAVSIQSSYAYFQKSEEAMPFYECVSERYDAADVEDMAIKWGGTKPDELFYSGAIAKYKLDADGGTFIFFGIKHSKDTNRDIQNKFKILSLFGNSTGTRMVKLRYAEFYDNLMNKYCRTFSKETGQPMQYIFKRSWFEEAKYVNS